MQVTGRPDQFDRNIILGLFNYPNSPSIGPDGTNEIDIEFAQWGDPNNPNRLNWVVYPPALGPGRAFSFLQSINAVCYSSDFIVRLGTQLLGKLHGRVTVTSSVARMIILNCLQDPTACSRRTFS